MKRSELFGFAATVLLVSSVVIFSLASAPKVTKAYTPTSEDQDFVNWMGDTQGILDSHQGNIKSAGINNDYKEQARWYRSTYDCCKKALDEIDFYGVSPEVQPAKDEYKLYLQDLKWSAYYDEIATSSFDEKAKGEARRTACIYYDSAYEHWEKFFDLIPPIPISSNGGIFTIGPLDTNATPSQFITPIPTPTLTPTPVVTIAPTSPTPSPTFTPAPTPSAPGFSTVFAIGSLLGVAYLVLRRSG